MHNMTQCTSIPPSILGIHVTGLSFVGSNAKQDYNLTAANTYLIPWNPMVCARIPCPFFLSSGHYVWSGSGAVVGHSTSHSRIAGM